MKKNIFELFISCSTFFFAGFTGIETAFAQNPLVKQWDKDFGGNGVEALYSIQQTADSGFILGGYSQSGIGGDKTQSSWGYTDYWIIKTDALGNKQWDKDFGGIDDDALYSLQQTADGGFILAGYSTSGISGDKTQPVWGQYDYWIIKTDALGVKQWDKDFGGTDYDILYSIQQTTDGGFILGGYSTSGISGDKTQPLKGATGDADYWIVKIDAFGNKQWDKDFGGTGSDVLSCIRQTFDGGYILGGYSASGVGGDKSQPAWGSNDYWIIKTDSLGSKQWDKDFGGTGYQRLNSITQTLDGGFIFGGISNSGISGNKSAPLWGGTGLDYWIVKTDDLGNIEWDKDIGGTSYEDEFGTIVQTSDGGYLLEGTSYSPISGNKTESNLGSEQSWAVKTDALGNVVWDKTLLTYGHNENGMAIETTDGCYVMGTSDYGGIGGNKSQPTWGGNDYWIIKFCDSTLVPAAASFLPNDHLCPGTCTGFLNLSVHATSYQWSFPGASPSTSTDIFPSNICYNTPGTYDVTLIASNVMGSDTLTLINCITVYPAPPAQGIAQSGDTLIANTGAVTYQWYYNSNPVNGATDYFYVAPASGNYNVVCTDANGCEVEAAVFNVIAGILPSAFIPLFSIFPNPVEKELKIKNEELKIESAVLKIYNTLGVLAAQSEIKNPKSFGRHRLAEGDAEMSVDVSELNPGIYCLELISNEKTFRTKFIKQ